MRALVALLLLVCATARAGEAYPNRPVRLVVPFPAGAGLDVVGRAMAQKLTERWGRSMVVDNRPGAAGTLGAEIVARSAPDGHTLLIAGIGSMETLKYLAGIDLVHVPHKGPAQGVTALATGEVQLSIQSQLSAGPLIQSGRVRIIAGTGAKRLPELPEVPVIAEDVPGYEFYVWYGVTAPANTPSSIVARLNREMRAVFQVAELRDMMLAQGSEMVLSSESEFAAFLDREVKMWNTVIRNAGLRPE